MLIFHLHFPYYFLHSSEFTLPGTTVSGSARRPPAVRQSPSAATLSAIDVTVSTEF